MTQNKATCKTNIQDNLKDECKLTPKTLHNVIIQRKLERKRNADEKRQHDLRRIAEMNSKHGIHPVADLFPTEIWVKIMWDPALTPRDRYNLYQVHPVFQEITGGRETQDVLLPLVLDYMVPFVAEYLIEYDDNDIIPLRGVSKSIRNSVDNWIEKDLLDSMKKLHIPRFDPIYVCLDETNIEDVFNNVMAYSKVSMDPRLKRFFLRSLQLSFEIPSDIADREDNAPSFSSIFAEFKERIFEILEEIGDQILLFGLSITEMQEMPKYGVSISEIYSTVRELLLLMPNLKWLAICTDGDVSASLPKQPMPKLSSLERVDMNMSGNPNHPLDPIIDAVLVVNPHVMYINIEDIDTFDFCNSNEQMSCSTIFYTYPTVANLALQTMHLDFEVCDCDWQGACDKNFTNSNWNLKKLTLELDKASLHEVFECIQRNFPNLEYLKLMVNDVTVGAELNFLRLPNLQRFKLYFGDEKLITFTGDFHFFFSLHFLLYCGKLEKLNWFNEVDEKHLKKIRRKLRFGSKNQQSQRLIKFKGECEARNWNLSGSNVWDIFPQLKVIKANSDCIICHVFHRDELLSNTSKHKWKRCNII